MSFEQLVLLMQRYDISLERLTDPSSVRFHLPAFKSPPKNIFEYLSQSEKNLAGLQSPQSILRYAAVEMPFYYYLAFPHLAAFKFYMWGRTLWHSNRGTLAKFNFEEYTKDAPLQSLMKSIQALNCNICTEEIWNISMLDITLSQIHYCYNAGLFERTDDAQMLFEDMKNLIKHIESVAAMGQKTKDGQMGSVQISNNELFQNPMFILSETPQLKLIYTNFDVPYFMVSNDMEMYQVGINFFNRIKSFSKDITTANELNRHDFFKQLNQKHSIYQQMFKEKHLSLNGFSHAV